MTLSNFYYKVPLFAFTSVITAEMIYETILSPYNRVNLDFGIVRLDGIHTYEMAFITGILLYGILINASLPKILLSIFIYVAIHETIWVSFDIIAYPVAVTFWNQLRPTNILWFVITILTMWFKPIKFNFNSKVLYGLFILFNVIWMVPYGYINTLMIMPDGSHPFAFNITANAFEWFYNIMFTGIFVVVYKWK